MVFVNHINIIFLSLFLFVSCLTNENIKIPLEKGGVEISFDLMVDNKDSNIDGLKIEERDYLLGLRDNESFFLSDAFFTRREFLF